MEAHHGHRLIWYQIVLLTLKKFYGVFFMELRRKSTMKPIDLDEMDMNLVVVDKELRNPKSLDNKVDEEVRCGNTQFIHDSEIIRLALEGKEITFE
jgi:hypothetical protein